MRHVLPQALCAAGLLAGSASAQFTQDNSIPSTGSFSENVDFGDVDLDGDWDVVIADGGDNGNDQNRIWINIGGAQGGTVGTYQDRTNQLFPAFVDDSRDIEFVDFDADADLDLYVSNTAQISNQGNRWLTNQGGKQGGMLGNYVDETGARWVGLNAANSSVPTALLLPDAANPETFIDWSCDCDFGDLDNDGDMDLFHSSYGGAFGGRVPSRIYLNDGDGFFEEFNPSGFKLGGQNIQDGDPGLWCEGVQENQTDMTDGSECDVAMHALDIDLGDMDGDLDLDILHGSRETLPRIFHNRLEENGGTPADLAFRDVSNDVLPAGWATGGNNYEQELGDIDNDGDLDLYGLNWGRPGGGFGNTVVDQYFFNQGGLQGGTPGVYGQKTELPNSQADDNEGDFLDYDNDGDLDLFVANFSGPNKLYRNQFVETGSVDFVLTASGLGGGISLDGDCADYDNDGATDFIISQDNGANNEGFLNTTGTVDAIAPALYRLEDVANGGASTTNDAVRVQVYDNASYYITWYNPTVLEVTVDGIAIPDIPMVTSGGQIFRGELPGNLVGDVEYTARSTDEYGNSGVSATESYTNSGSTGTAQGPFSPTPFGEPTLRSLTQPEVGMPLHLVAGNATPGAGGIWLFSLNEETGGLGLGDGLILNVAFPLLAGGVLVDVADGAGNMTVHDLSVGAAFSGLTLHTQVLFADGINGNAWASTRSLALSFP